MNKKLLILAPTLFLIILIPTTILLNHCIPSEKSYCNNADGYYFTVPKGFKADESFYPTSVHFNSKNTTIEIYTHNCASENAENYINSTSEAIYKNKIDYKNIIETKDENKNNILKWERQKLKQVKNDKNYYIKLDIPYRNLVYTMLIKSTDPIGDHRYYSDRLTFHDNIITVENTNLKKGRKPNFNKETEDFYNKYFSDESSLTWGIFRRDFLNDGLKKYEKKINHDFEILQWYTSFYKEYKPEKVIDVLHKAHSEDKTVVLTLQPSWVHERGNDFLRLLNGEYDEFLNDYINDIKNFGHPVIFRFANEMNGDWCEYCAYNMSLDTHLYREAYRYVFKLFEEKEATNIIWVWNPNGASYPKHKWNYEEMYYPGDEYVDIIGLTSYNTGTFYSEEKWTSFNDLYVPLYDSYMKKYDMPFMITEFACARKGGDKEKWTRDMLKQIEDFENIKMAIWWSGSDYAKNGKVSRAYSIDDSEEMIEIFKDYFEKH